MPEANPQTNGSASCDVVVIGGGPGGSTAASLLAERGYRVVLLEKARHPRFHIGESLLPANLPILERLGVAAPMHAIGMAKWGAEFVSPGDGRRQEFRFAQAWNKSQPLAYQVRRSQFDEILIRRAAQLGAQVIEGCRVRDVNFLEGTPGPGGRAPALYGSAHSTPAMCGSEHSAASGGGALGAARAAVPGARAARASVRVQAEHDDGRSEEWTADFLIDASGRDTFLGNLLKAKHRNKKHNSAALYAHFAGAQRECGKREGNITIYWFDHGWFWFIPLADGATSVGAVVWPYYMKRRDTSVREFFLATVALCPPLAERLRDATLVSEVEATGNYSYACDHSHGANYLLVGDAYCFIDPVFSSGVMLAMNSGVAAADAIHACRTRPAAAAAALREFDRISRHGPKQFSWFIYRVSHPTMREMFLDPRNVLRMEEALLSLLAGDIFGRTPIWGRLRLFKAVYHVLSLAAWSRSLRASRLRAANIRADPEHVTGE
jgi:flavin-dependent dehydrogenase